MWLLHLDTRLCWRHTHCWLRSLCLILFAGVHFVLLFFFLFHLLHLLWNNNNSQGAKDICALISHCPLHPAFL